MPINPIGGASGGGDVTSAEFVRLQALLATNFQEDILRASSSGINARGVLHDNYSSATYVDTANAQANRITADNAYRTATASAHSLLVQSEVATTPTDTGANFYDTTGNHGVLTAVGTAQTEVPSGAVVDAGTAFEDASGNAGVLTALGNAQTKILAANDPWGGDEPVLILDGSGDYVKISDTPSLEFGANPFTIEIWVKPTNFGVQRTLFAHQGTSSNRSFDIDVDTSGRLVFYYSTNGTSNAGSFTSTGSMTAGAWNHCVITRDVDTLRFYFEGTQSSTASMTGITIANSTGSASIGAVNADVSPANYFLGEVGPVLVTNDTCNYPDGTTFVPSASKPAVGSVDFYFDHTPEADPYGGTQPILAVDGNSDGVSIADSDDWTFGAGDYTVEAWVKWNSTTGQQSIVSQIDNLTTDQYAWQFYNIGNDLYWWTTSSLAGSTTAVITAASAISAGVWTHVAAVCQSGTNRLYVGGVQVGTVAGLNVVNSTSAMTIGYRAISGGSAFLNGKIADVRITKGTCNYPDGTTFTPPTTKPAVGSENFYFDHDVTNTTFTDSTGVHTANITNTAVKHTLADPQFGSTCMYFNGSADLSVADTASSGDWNLGASGTVDCFVKFKTLGSIECIMMTGDQTSTHSWKLSKSAANEFVFTCSDNATQTSYNTTLTTTGAALVANTWHHVRVVVNGASSVIYVDSVSRATGTIGTIDAGNGTLVLGKNSGGTERLTGYIEEWSVAPSEVRDATEPAAPYTLTPLKFRLPTVPIECDVAPTKVYAQVTIESGAPYDTVTANTDLKCYIAQTGNEDPDDVGFVGNELTLVAAGTTSDGYMLYEVENATITNGSVDNNKFIIHSPTTKDLRAHDVTVLLS